MKFNTRDFPINKQILYGTEDEIVYEEEKCGLMETWDALSTKYMDNIENQNIKENTFIKLLNDTKICVDTLLTTAGLLEKNILKASPIRKREEMTYNFKDAMISTCISILDKGIEALIKASENIKKLDEVLFEGLEGKRDLSFFKRPIRLSHGQLRIHFGKDEYVCLDSDFRFIYPDHWRPTGLVITLRYRNSSYSTVIPPNINRNEIFNIAEYFRECNLIGKRSKHNLSVEIVRNEQKTSLVPPSSDKESISKDSNSKDLSESNLSNSKDNFKSSCNSKDLFDLDLCKLDLLNHTIFRIIENKKTFDCLNDDCFFLINISLSNIFYKSLINKLETYEMIPLANVKLIDDLPKDFVLVSDKIYKFKRRRFDFDFFIDENRIDIEV